MTTCNTKTTHKGFFTLNLDDDLSEPAGVAPLALFFHQSVSQSVACLLTSSQRANAAAQHILFFVAGSLHNAVVKSDNRSSRKNS